MKASSRALLLLILSSCAVAAGTYPQPLGDRSYLVHVPNVRPPQPVLILALHGSGGNAAQMERLTGFSTLADPTGTIVIYPEGRNGKWNDGRGVVGGDDVGFLSRLIDEAIARYNVNPKRVFVAGFSNGATMAYRLACELSEKVTGIASVSGSIALDVFNSCHPTKPVSVYAIAGTADPIIPYYGGTIDFLGIERGIVTSQDTNRDFWRGLNHCSSSGCDFGTRVELTTLNGFGHKYPGTDNGFGPVLDALLKPTSPFPASQAIWNFFFSLPPRLTQEQKAALVLSAFYTYSGEGPGAGLGNWVNHVTSRLFTFPYELVNDLQTRYLYQPGTAEKIVRNMFREWDGSAPSPESVSYWADGVRRERWTFVQLKTHFIRTYLYQSGTAEQIARNVFREFSGRGTDSNSISYWAWVLRTNGWTFVNLMSHFMATYLPLAGTAEQIARTALYDFGDRTLAVSSIQYWSNVLRVHKWTYLQLMSYFYATYPRT